MRASTFIATLFVSFVFGVSANAGSRLEIEGLDSDARVIRDIDGIVHIYAKTEHDLLFLQGWAQARDRLFQLDLQRRTASGTLAELLGPAVLASDIQSRTIGLRRAADRSLGLLSPEGLRALDAFAAGVNAYATTNPLPLEYLGLELDAFEPWTPADSMTIAKGLAVLLSLQDNLTEGLERTIALTDYVAELGPVDGSALFLDDVFRSAPFDPASTVPDASQSPPVMPPPSPVVFDVSGIRPEALQIARGFLGLTPAGSAVGAHGSNEWVISGALTESGRPLLANDPHLPFSTPALWYPIHLAAPAAGFDVIGASLPGTPFVILGHNRRISWGATNHRMDDTDIFQEQLVPNGQPPIGLGVLVGAELKPIELVEEVFRFNVVGDGVIGNLVTVPPTDVPPILVIPHRNNGPIIGFDPASGVALSVMFTGFSGTREIDAFRGFNLSHDLEDFVDALQFFDVGSQNWAYADTAGTIAYFTSAELPLRRDLQQGSVHGLPPAFIRDGTSPLTEWLPLATPQPGHAIAFEILPFEEMPQIVDPAAGYVVNANNDTNGDTLDNRPLNQLRTDGSGGIRYISWKQQAGLRAGRITQLLEERLALGPVTADDMRTIQADVIPLDVALFRPLVVNAFDAAGVPGAPQELVDLAADPGIAEAVARLADWDGSMSTGIAEGYDASDVDGERLEPTQAEIRNSIAATIYHVWRSEMIANTIDSTLAAQNGLPPPNDQRALIGLGHLIRSFPSNGGIGASGLNFFDVPGVGSADHRRDIIVLRSLRGALDLLASDAFAAAFGNSSDQDMYRWGRLHRVALPSAAGATPVFSTDGGHRTVDPGTLRVRVSNAGDFLYRDGTTRRYVADFAGRRRIAAQSSLPGGASENMADLFFDNLLEPWLTNDTYVLRQRRSDVLRAAVEFLVLRPPGRDDDDDGDEDD